MMLYYEFTVGDKEYKLRLTTRNIVSLEKNIGCNPLMIFGNGGDKIPEVTTMVYILHSALQAYEHGIVLTDAYAIFDKWLEDGHTTTDFIPIILDIYRCSGIMPKDEETKNA